MSGASGRVLPNFHSVPSVCVRHIKEAVIHSALAKQRVPCFWVPVCGYTSISWPESRPSEDVEKVPHLVAVAREAFFHATQGVQEDEWASEPPDAEADHAGRVEALRDLKTHTSAILEAAASALEELVRREHGDVSNDELMERVSDDLDDFVAVLATRVAKCDEEIEAVEVLLLSHL